MDPSEIICLSSNDEHHFDQNQRRLKDFYKQEDRNNFQNHLKRILDEVNEGKRKFLQTVALPDISNIPITLPLDKSLTVTIAISPGDLQFTIMSQGSNTSSLSPRPVKETKVKPYEALLYQSSVTTIDHISVILKNHGLKISPDIPVWAPLPDERSCHAPRGSSKL